MSSSSNRGRGGTPGRRSQGGRQPPNGRRPGRKGEKSAAGGRREATRTPHSGQPFRPRRARAPAKPALPAERARLPRDVYRDVRAAARPGEAEDVVKAYAAAGEELERGDVARAIELLEWAKSAAARSAAIREALGVARYHAGDFPGAHSELLAYRRLSGRQDQNHLLADCARAADRPDKVVEYVDAMDPASVPADRIAEGIMVLAGARADRGDVEGALRTLERGAELAPVEVAEHHVRLWYMAGDLSERAGDRDAARDYFEAVAAVDPDFLDTVERLAALAEPPST